MTADENVSFEELCASYEAMDQAEYQQVMAEMAEEDDQSTDQS
ncbi:hypothetical protein ACIRP3_41560 [Streptomyces sp. NPDC101209]